MPYKYKNILNIQGSDGSVREALLQIMDEKLGVGSIDFNKITPMPRWAKCGSEGMREQWCRENWTVPENAGGLEASVKGYDGGDTIEFDTVGGNVHDLMQKLSVMFPDSPDLAFDYLWASEDVGKDGGMMQFTHGELTYEYIPEADSQEAYELAFDIFSTDAAEHGLVFDSGTGTYCHKSKLSMPLDDTDDEYPGIDYGDYYEE